MGDGGLCKGMNEWTLPKYSVDPDRRCDVEE